MKPTMTTTVNTEHTVTVWNMVPKAIHVVTHWVLTKKILGVRSEGDDEFFLFHVIN